MDKILIASDIHGSAHFCRLLMDRIADENPCRILLLGDLLYHGPRNDLPEEYAPKAVIPMLETLRDRLLCVRGNCDGEVDQMVLSFPILADYGCLFLNGRTIYFTHGHHYNENMPLPHCRGDILLCGHTHIPAWTEKEDFLYLNPGSVSIPKEGSCHSYMTWENGSFFWKDVTDGSVYHKL